MSEKFFALCEVFGAQDVGMLTGDASVNADAPVICCTAEILANIALREGAQADVGLVVMDEFHFYAEPDRGWAWQVPLIELPKAQFVLMSATLGDVSELAEDLSRRTGRETALVTDAERPVPLTFTWALTPLAETLEELVHTHQAPVYVVHFTQKDAVEHATGLLNAKLGLDTARPPSWTRSRSGWPASGSAPASARRCRSCCAGGSASTTRGCCRATGGWSSSSPRPGCSPSSAARTPSASASTCRSGRCCSPVSRSTTATGSRILRIREFHQIAGRAGRAGFDTSGNVVVQAPPHTIENEKAKAKSDAKNAAMSVEKQAKRKSKPQLRKPPEGTVVWTEQTFDRLVTGVPEQLVSRMRVDNSMLINVLGREEDAFPVLRRILTDNHETERDKRRLSRRALRLARSLVQSGTLTRLDEVDAFGRRYVLTVDLPEDFALNQELAHFALAALDVLDPEAEEHTLDIVSVVESVLEGPRQILFAQQYAARGEAVNEMKADGIEYEERMALLDQVTWPQPLAELLEATYELYRQSHPWLHEDAAGAEVDRPRDVRAGDELHRLRGPLPAGPVRGPGAALPHRRLPDDPPDGARLAPHAGARGPVGVAGGDDPADRLLAARRVGGAHRPRGGRPPGRRAGRATSSRPRRGPSRSRTARSRVMIRNAMWRRVELVARDDLDGLMALERAAADRTDPPGEVVMTRSRWDEAIEAYYQEHDRVDLDADARGPRCSRSGPHPDGRAGPGGSGRR